jgi:hypothetical protein
MWFNLNEQHVRFTLILNIDMDIKREAFVLVKQRTLKAYTSIMHLPRDSAPLLRYAGGS